MLDVLNERLIAKGEDPIAFDHDCREGICGTCGLVIDGRPHGPRGDDDVPAAHAHFKRRRRGLLEPWRAAAFPVIKDLVSIAAPSIAIIRPAASSRRTPARREGSQRHPRAEGSCRSSAAFSVGVSGAGPSSALFTNSPESIAAPSWTRKLSIASFIGVGSSPHQSITPLIASSTVAIICSIAPRGASPCPVASLFRGADVRFGSGRWSFHTAWVKMRRTRIEHMSAGLPAITDIARRGWNGRKVPKPVVSGRSNSIRSPRRRVREAWAALRGQRPSTS